MCPSPVSTQENIILIDWFSMTSKIDTSDGIKFILGMDKMNWMLMTGMHGFKDRWYYEGISIHFNGSEKLGLENLVWLEMSGQGCRAFETYSEHKDWKRLFDLIISPVKLDHPDNPSEIVECENYHLTRLDVAYDDWEGVLNIDQLDRELRKQHIVTRFRNYGVDRSYVKEDITLYYGSKKSDILFRCYNKAAERGREDEVKHWIRFEMQLRDDRALAFLYEYMNTGCIGSVFSGVINNYLRYVKPTNDSHKDRWPTCSWWKKFAGSAERISLYTKKGVDYNLAKLENYVFNSAGNAIDTCIQILGKDEFNKKLKARQSKPSAKYTEMLERFSKAKRMEEAGTNSAAILEYMEKVGLI